MCKNFEFLLELNNMLCCVCSGVKWAISRPAASDHLTPLPSHVPARLCINRRRIRISCELNIWRSHLYTKKTSAIVFLPFPPFQGLECVVLRALSYPDTATPDPSTDRAKHQNGRGINHFPSIYCNPVSFWNFNGKWLMFILYVCLILKKVLVS